MEISLLPKNAVKIKGKHSNLVINPATKTDANAIIFLGINQTTVIEKELLVINGPGEYEVGGIKITGIKSGNDTIYSLHVDGIDILLGNQDTIEKIQNKLKEHQIVLLHTSASKDASFVTNFSPRVVLFYGEHAGETIKTINKDGATPITKYQVALEKLPAEMETILLAAS